MQKSSPLSLSFSLFLSLSLREKERERERREREREREREKEREKERERERDTVFISHDHNFKGFFLYFPIRLGTFKRCLELETLKVSTGAKTRNRYNQVTHLTQVTNW